MAQPASLTFNSFEVIKVVFDRGLEYAEDAFQVDLQHIIEVDKDNKNIFKTIFILNLSITDNPFNLQVQAAGSFTISGEVDQKVYDNYLSISAPSILYPYIRAFISNMTVQAGIKPIIIPPLNFSALAPSKAENDPSQNL